VSSGPIVEVLSARLLPAAASWLAEALAEVSRSGEALARRWSGAGRRLGKNPVALAPDESERLRAAGAAPLPDGWGADECGRVLLLLAALTGMPAESHEAVVEDLYRTGETRERQALLRGLAYLPRPERFVTMAVEAVRANVLPELEALACENPFPARHFPEPAFNQLVMKSLFNGVSLRRIVGIEARRAPELARMVTAYASERRAAGRTVPDDVAFVLEGGA
jgi:hypothetical protein